MRMIWIRLVMPVSENLNLFKELANLCYAGFPCVDGRFFS